MASSATACTHSSSSSYHVSIGIAWRPSNALFLDSYTIFLGVYVLAMPCWLKVDLTLTSEIRPLSMSDDYKHKWNNLGSQRFCHCLRILESTSLSAPSDILMPAIALSRTLGICQACVHHFLHHPRATSPSRRCYPGASPPRHLNTTLFL